LTEDRAGRSRELISFFSAFADQVVHEFGMRYDGKVMMHGTVQYPFAGLACWRCLGGRWPRPRSSRWVTCGAKSGFCDEGQQWLMEFVVFHLDRQAW
jgi:hypothetical protein